MINYMRMGPLRAPTHGVRTLGIAEQTPQMSRFFSAPVDLHHVARLASTLSATADPMSISVRSVWSPAYNY